ncbi:SUKH-3 domain-containing protein [Streptomyces sp. NPDC058954]|uniref:SUKH-3 domain-containing protein n=1 Tax=Streptomyces sp. NPDC058954 TaxID=3346677 RepID=UPI0036B6A38D
MHTFPGEVEQVLRESGWAPGRLVEAEPWLTAFEAEGLQRHAMVSAFLAEFGGIAVNISGPGISRAREPFEFDPMLCLGEGDRFLEWGEEIERSIFPVGVHDEGRFFLGIDELGELYLVETWLASFGRMPEAMSNLILGVQPIVIDDGSS